MNTSTMHNRLRGMRLWLLFGVLVVVLGVVFLITPITSAGTP